MEKGVFMSKQDQFKYRQIADFRSGRLSRLKAAQLLRLSERSISRLASRVASHGISGAVHGSRGKRPKNKLNDRIKAKVMKLVASRYYDFNMLHCLEMLDRRHRLKVGRETFRKWCHEKQLVKRKKRRRSQPRVYRSRMPAEGYLLQMDGSPHRYNGRDIWSLVLAIDDATSEIPYGEFFQAETTAACMKVLGEIIRRKGLPRALYVDKAGWAGGGKRVEFSQFHRACEELGIQILFANSPEAKGRVERAFDTIQDRIIPELRIAKIRSRSDANTYLKNIFLKKYWNKTNTVTAADLTSDYRRVPDLKILKEILCYKSKRAVDRVQCISLNSDIYQLRHPSGMSLAKKRIEIRHYEDKSLAFYFEQAKLSYEKLKRPKKTDSDWVEDMVKMERTLGLPPRSKRVYGTNSLGN